MGDINTKLSKTDLNNNTKFMQFGPWWLSLNHQLNTHLLIVAQNLLYLTKGPVIFNTILYM